jgi:hypothetical protein
LDELYDMDGVDDVQNVVPLAHDPALETTDKSAVGMPWRPVSAASLANDVL